MAADTREPPVSNPVDASRSSAATSPEEPRQTKSALASSRNPNTLAALGSTNTAGGKVQEASIMDALRSLQPSDIKNVHQKPCVREALLTGIGGGFGVGGLRAIWGATVWSSCNWAVGTFVFGSFLMHEFCQKRRDIEKQGMKRAVEVLDRRRAEKRKKADELKAAKTSAEEQTPPRA